MSANQLLIDSEPVCRRAQNLAVATGDPHVQAASARLRKKFLEYAAAVCLDAKYPTEKTRHSESVAEVGLQEAIELELLAMRLHVGAQSVGHESTVEPPNLHVN